MEGIPADVIAAIVLCAAIAASEEDNLPCRVLGRSRMKDVLAEEPTYLYGFSYSAVVFRVDQKAVWNSLCELLDEDPSQIGIRLPLREEIPELCWSIARSWGPDTYRAKELLRVGQPLG